MTIDEERWRAIENVREWLYKLFTDRKTPVPKTGELRRMSYILSKHYPEPYWIEKVRKLYEGEER